MTEIPTADVIEEDEIGDNAEIVDAVEFHYDEYITQEMNMTFSLSRVVKCLIMFDFLFALLYALENNYYLSTLIVSFIGYRGADKFNKSAILFYSIYIFLINVIRLTFLFLLYTQTDEKTGERTEISFILAGICGVMGIWISNIIYRFYRLIRNLTPEQLANVKEISRSSDYSTYIQS